MGYNTVAQIRLACGMGNTPSDSTITYWVGLIDGLIVSYDASPDTSIAAIIEARSAPMLHMAEIVASNIPPTAPRQPA